MKELLRSDPQRRVGPYGPEAGKEKIQQEDPQNLYPVKFMAIMSDAHLTPWLHK